MMITIMMPMMIKVAYTLSDTNNDVHTYNINVFSNNIDKLMLVISDGTNS